MSATTASQPSGTAGGRCLACDTPIVGPFCHACGQKQDDCRRSILRLATETIADVAALDGRFLRTARSSLATPGRHVHQYAHGRRSPFTPPVRFFLVVTFTFFFTLWITGKNILVLQLVPEGQAELEGNINFEVRDGDAEEARAARETAAEALAEIGVPPPPELTEKPAAPEGTAAADPDETGAPRIVPYGGFFLPAQDVTYTEEEREWLRSFVQVGEDGNGSVTFLGREITRDRMGDALIQTMQNPTAFNNALNETIPFLMLIFVPLTALLGAVFIRGPDALIYDHLLLAIQTHAFAFLVLTLILWTGWLLPSEAGTLAFFIGVPLYYVMALRGAFRRGWLKSVAATLFVGVVYWTFFIMALGAAVLVSFWGIL